MKKIAEKVPDCSKPAETRLNEQNKDKPEVSGTEEVLLEDVRKGLDEGGTYEARLQKLKERKAAPNQGLTGLPEKRLDTASHGIYPHRNSDAWELTGEKRPVNALREEMGERSDAAQQERWEKAYTAGPKTKRSVDKDIGKQMQQKAFNMRQQKVAGLQKNYGRYLDYRQTLAGKNEFNLKNATIIQEVKKLDDEMVRILTASSGRQLTEDEKKTIQELKVQKTTILLKSSE